MGGSQVAEFVHVKNDEMYERALKSIAGGMLSNYKKIKGHKPLYVERVEGAYVYDYDGNKHYDFSLNFGPAILGHSNERLKEAIRAELDKHYTPNFGEIQIKAAEKIKSVVKGMDVLRFGLSGTEVDMMAIRTARAYTKKNMIVKFAGHYHGAADYIIGGVADTKENPVAIDTTRPGDFYSEMATTSGRAKNALDDMYVLEWNNLDGVKELFEKKGDDIACIIMEPFPVNLVGFPPQAGFLEGVRELCTKHNVVLIFDEVITGFRINIGGAAAVTGVTPDLWTFSKALAGGIPAGAFGGREEVMQPIIDCEAVSAGTFPGFPISCAAMISLIDQLQENDCAILKHIERLGTMLGEGFKKMAEKHGLPMIIQGFPGAIVPVFTMKDKIVSNEDAIENAIMDAYWYFSVEMNKRGIMNLQRYSVCAAHTEEDIQHAINVADEVLANMAVLLSQRETA